MSSSSSHATAGFGRVESISTIPAKLNFWAVSNGRAWVDKEGLGWQLCISSDILSAKLV